MARLEGAYRDDDLLVAPKRVLSSKRCVGQTLRCTGTENVKVSRSESAALSGAGARFPLVVALYLIVANGTKVFLGFSTTRQPGFGLGQLLRRHGPADVFLAFLDLFEHRGRRFFRKQVPHVSGNGSGLTPAIWPSSCSDIFDLEKCSARRSCAEGSPASAASIDRGECVARLVGGGLRLGWRVVHGQVEQLGAAGDAQLVKNAEQVVLDRMRAEVESVSNFAVGHTAGQVLDDLAFARGKQFDSLVIGGADERRVGKRFERLIQIDATRPDLSFMDGANALAEALQPLLLGKNALWRRRESTPGLPGAWRSRAR